jgi:hypothetical protein
MENEELKELICRRKKENREKWIKYKHELEDDLIAFCIAHGGHYWYDWQRYLSTYFDPSLNRFEEQRDCSACGHREHRGIENE